MAYQPSPKQALFLWKLIASNDDRSVMQSKTRPELSRPERQQLLDAGFIDLERRGAAGYLSATDRAWRWAGQTKDVRLSRSAVAAEVLESLVGRLVPFLAERGMDLVELFPTTEQGKAVEPAGADDASPHAQETGDQTLSERIERMCLALANGKRKTRVRLSRLRDELPDVARRDLDRSLLALQDAQRLVLYREDNTAALTDDDRRAALTINNEPRHLVMLGAGA